MSQQLLTMNDIAQLIDMPYGRLVKVLHRIEGFPKPVDKKGLYRVYERAAVEAFNQQYNLADTVNDCFIQYYQERYSIQKAKAEKSGLNNTLAVQFLRGEYRPKSAPVALDSALAVGVHPLPRPRLRTRVASDWYDDLPVPESS